MKISLLQTRANGDPQENMRVAEEAFKTCDSPLLIFPETFQSLYPLDTPMETVKKQAESLDGSFVCQMRELTTKYHKAVIFGMREETDGHPYNTVVTIDETGEIKNVYHKHHLYDAFGHKESDYVTAGTEPREVFQMGGFTFGVQVCYEIRFPEVSRTLTEKGAEVLVIPTAWVKGPNKIEQLRTLAKARAIENGAYVLVVNQTGEDTTGFSLAVDPLGNIIKEAAEEPTVLTIELEKEKIEETRKVTPSWNYGTFTTRINN